MKLLKKHWRALLPYTVLMFVLAACTDRLPTDAAPNDGHCDIDDFHFGDNCGPHGQGGTHVRLGHLYWRDLGSNEVEFTYIIGLRRNFYSPLPNVGDVRTFATVNFGTGQGAASPPFTVTFVDVANNWFEARATFTKQYTNPGPHTVTSTTCCRISLAGAPWWHRNNPDHSTRFWGVVDFRSQGSPATSLPSIVGCPANGQCQFNVAATAPGGQTIRYRFATGPEMGQSNSIQPGPPHAPNPATIDPGTGVYSWNTVGAALSNHATATRTVYSTQVVMETVNSAQEVTSASMIDFLIELGGIVNAPPVWITPPTPADGSVFDVEPGQLLAIQVQATDPDGDPVTLGALGLPPGATFPIPAAAATVTSTMNFTPTAAQLGNSFTVNFLATDDGGASATPRSVVINVVDDAGQPPPPPPPPPPGVCVVIDFEGMGTHGDQVTSFDLDGTAISITVTPGGPNSLPMAVLFDSDITTGLDPDLRWQNGGVCVDCQGLGHMLVIPDNRGFDPHGDSNHGGTFRFSGFPAGWSFTEFLAIDSDDWAPWTVHVDGTQVATVPIGSDGSVMLVPVAANAISSNVEIWLPSSGAIDNLQFCPVPD